MAASSVSAGNFSEYRNFKLDSGLVGVAEQAQMKPADVTVIHERPAMIEELAWRAPSGDSVKNIKFGFYEGELFRMVVSYNDYNTEGLTTQDMVEAISGTFGDKTDSPPESITLPTIYDDEELVQVLARWTDPNWSFNLVRSKHAPTFYLVALSAQLYPTAEAAKAEGLRLDRQEAPRKELRRLEEREEQRRLQMEQARTDNVPSFRP
jgi:hypothetical protein